MLFEKGDFLLVAYYAGRNSNYNPNDHSVGLLVLNQDSWFKEEHFLQELWNSFTWFDSLVDYQGPVAVHAKTIKNFHWNPRNPRTSYDVREEDPKRVQLSRLEAFFSK